ncbi:PD-(D/E)XK nuclease-like domain-containing protein [Paraburkholderia sp. HD33-4]|uniref:PD-(D/E)XK nuclease-like domain-containing protein n=1 Tax=Paraburkholderia sp. HD33-4 TaxID=2883242 RepID=UPI001F19F41E|nr:PD-(D/E)XK nuclease-like domain-containing protein [Paraburkholderia sp. HD33-4]
MIDFIPPLENGRGLVENLDIERYHALEPVSKSQLDDLNVSPFHFYSWHRDPLRPVRESKSGQLEGNLAHCGILEPDAFQDRYVVGPAVNRNTKVWRDFVETHENAVAIQPDQYETAMRQADSVRALPEIQAYLARGKAEVSAFWTDPITGVECRCRPDFVHPLSKSSVVLLDVKTFSSVDPDDFRRQAARKRYHVQDTFYSAGFSEAARVTVEKFIFVVVESAWPYAAAAYTLGNESREQGFLEWRRLLDVYEECVRTKTWPGYAEKTTQIDLPSWAFTSQEVEISYV